MRIFDVAQRQPQKIHLPLLSLVLVVTHKTLPHTLFNNDQFPDCEQQKFSVEFPLFGGNCLALSHNACT